MPLIHENHPLWQILPEDDINSLCLHFIKWKLAIFRVLMNRSRAYLLGTINRLNSRKWFCIAEKSSIRSRNKDVQSSFKWYCNNTLFRQYRNHKWHFLRILMEQIHFHQRVFQIESENGRDIEQDSFNFILYIYLGQLFTVNHSKSIVLWFCLYSYMDKWRMKYVINKIQKYCFDSSIVIISNASYPLWKTMLGLNM